MMTRGRGDDCIDCIDLSALGIFPLFQSSHLTQQTL